jgi:hypothetical protein
LTEGHFERFERSERSEFALLAKPCQNPRLRASLHSQRVPSEVTDDHSVLVPLGGALFLPAIALAQDATVNGTVTDSTGGVLPGVTVTALHTATGNTFFAVTDDRGNYRFRCESACID